MNPFNMNLLGPKGGIIVVFESESADKIKPVVYDIIRHQNASFGAYFAGTDAFAHALSQHVPPENVYREYNSGVVKDLLLRRETTATAKKAKIESKKLTTYDCNPKCTLLIHDCPTNTWCRDVTLRAAWMNSLCWRMSVIVTIPCSQRLPPAFMANVCYTFVLPEPDHEKRLLLYENAQICCAFEVFDAFCEALDCAFRVGGCIVVDSMGNSYTHVEGDITHNKPNTV